MTSLEIQIKPKKKIHPFTHSLASLMPNHSCTHWFNNSHLHFLLPTCLPTHFAHYPHIFVQLTACQSIHPPNQSFSQCPIHLHPYYQPSTLTHMLTKVWNVWYSRRPQTRLQVLPEKFVSEWQQNKVWNLFSKMKGTSNYYINTGLSICSFSLHVLKNFQ